MQCSTGGTVFREAFKKKKFHIWHDETPLWSVIPHPLPYNDEGQSFLEGFPQKRLLKIKKQEAKTLQTLIKQEDELRKALGENNELIKVLLDVESSEEMTLRKEIDELTKKRSTLQNKLEEVFDIN